MSLPTSPLKERITGLIAAQGPVSVAQFMTIALHDSDFGYYATRDPFGRAGDFITAPEISQMFGEMIGLWVAMAWMEQGKPQHPVLVELGPGRGTLMRDMLRALKAAPDFLKDTEVVMVEASPHLRGLQQEALKDAGLRVTWASQFDPPAGRPVFVVANEFFDALPIRQYVKTARGWCERMVTAKGGELTFALAPAPTPSALIPEAYAAAPDGGVYETAPAGIAVAEDIARQVEKNGGAALLIDYGYAHPDLKGAGFGETLQAVGAHRFADVLADPGAHDLSAHVDFGALAAAGKRGGAGVHGPITQRRLLTALGIGARADMLSRKNPGSADMLKAALERLTGPEKMGTLFKALAFLPGMAATAPGFEEVGHEAA